MINAKEKNQMTLGFSLVELTITMVLIGILAGVGGPLFLRSLQQERLKVATREVASWLEDVRLRAIQQSQTCAIEIINSNGIFQPKGKDKDGKDINSCANINTLDLPNDVDNANQIVVCSYDSIAAELSDTTCPNEANEAEITDIVFTPRGTASQGGLIKIHFSDKIPNRCIGVTEPLGMVRQGIENSTGCNFNTAF